MDLEKYLLLIIPVLLPVLSLQEDVILNVFIAIIITLFILNITKQSYPVDEIVKYLNSISDKIEAVVVSGGEPTIHA